MIIRSAVLEGTVDAPDRERFAAQLREVVLPAIAQYPRLREVRLRETIECDQDAPPVCYVFDLHFKNLEDMKFALASETRQRVRTAVMQAMTLFKGRVYHVVSSETGWLADVPGS